LRLNTVFGLECHVVCLARNRAKAEDRFAEYSGRSDLSFVFGDVAAGVPVQRPCNFVIHAASQASPKQFGVDPVGTMTANLLGMEHLLRLARSWGTEGFLFLSSGEVYGQVPADKVPTRECDYGYIDILNSRSCYAEAKRAAETLAVSYTRQHQLPCVIVRPFHTYGPGLALDGGRVYADFLRDVVNRRDLSINSDGKAVRAFCYLSDAVSGFFTVLLKGEHGQAYNVGNPAAAISIGDLAELVVSLVPELGLKVIRFGSSGKDYLASPIAINSPNIDRIARLGWRPHTSLCDGFSRTIRYFSDVDSHG
jgi:nucleoside-diphosphate-sugar epimerase